MRHHTDHFQLQELVDPQIYEDRGERAWELLRPTALITLDQLRNVFGPIIVNDWHKGGTYKESGLRRQDTTTGAKWSIHRYGGAFDCKPKACTVKDMFDYILAHSEEFPHLTTLEDIKATPTWLHFDDRNHNHGGIWVVNP